ncbi:hypothetical protein ACTJJ4_07575 [Microbacterium sp. 22195]|uniref:hypothetical protein n=1 Tax=Microbacterium sp. 22195 TaxID=3453891 RepID=UPI003F8567C5
MDEGLAELRATVAKLTAVEERRANLIEYRDRQLLELADAKAATWVQMQAVAGLSPRGLQLALERARARRAMTVRDKAT